MNRRRFLTGAGAALLSASGLGTALPSAASSQGSHASVLILGAGFAGASLAWALKRWAPSLGVTVVTAPERYWTCPFSNTALLEPTDLGALEVRYNAFSGAGAPTLIRARVRAVEPEHRALVLEDGRRLTHRRTTNSIAPVKNHQLNTATRHAMMIGLDISTRVPIVF